MYKFLIVLLLISGDLLAQKKSEKKNLPPDFEWVKKRGLAVSTSEVTVQMWVDYMNSKSLYSPDVLNELAPTSNVINDKCVCEKKGDEIEVKVPGMIAFRDTTYIEAGSKNKKHRQKEFCSTMPITGISYEQAQGFATWLTEKYNDDPKYSGLGLVFRLPTAEEYDSLLSDIIKPWKPGEDGYTAFTTGINSHGCAMFNHSHNSWCDNNKNMKMGFGYGVPMAAEFFFADANGLYDMMGNVAEMTNQIGVAKGGSCKDQASACQPGVINSYSGPQPWLGFRLVAELD